MMGLEIQTRDHSTSSPFSFHRLPQAFSRAAEHTPVRRRLSQGLCTSAPSPVDAMDPGDFEPRRGYAQRRRFLTLEG